MFLTSAPYTTLQALMIVSKLVYPLIIPAFILAMAIWIRTSVSLLPESYLPVMGYLPYILFFACAFLCLQFNQLRSLLIAIVLTASFLIIQMYLQNSLAENSTLSTYFLISTLVPGLLLTISWFPEKGIITPFGVLFLLIICLPIASAIYLHQHPSLLTTLVDYFSIRQWSFSVLPPLSMALYLAITLHQLLRLWLYQTPFDAAVSIILLSLMLNFILFDKPYISTIIFSAIQLMLIWSVLKQSHDMAYKDELTGLPGRRALNEALKSPGRKYVLAMMDIDHFKKFNDKYGHDVGDDVLKIVASKMSEVSGGGKSYRYGGEEFTVLFKGKELSQCIPHLEAVRMTIADYSISIRKKNSRPKSLKEGKKQRQKQRKPKDLSVTISIGVAQRTTELNTPTMVLKSADKALYKAKKAGRNCLISNK